MTLKWNIGQSCGIWFLEDCRMHVAGTVEKRGNEYIAGMCVPYKIDEDGNERDWQEAPEPFSQLEPAKKWVEKNARWMVGGEFIQFQPEWLSQALNEGNGTYQP